MGGNTYDTPLTDEVIQKEETKKTENTEKEKE